MAFAIALLASTSACAQQDDRTAWFREARFGMFIHWGLYAIPARGEWVMHNERIPVEEYEPLMHQFNPTGFDADEWVELSKAAGMKYIVITSKHHDGFSLFDTAFSHYKATNTPGGKDYLALLADACARQGQRLGFYYSLLDWHHPQYRTNLTAYNSYARNQIRELCTRYGRLAVLWFDGGWEHSAAEWGAEELCAMIRELQPGILINDRSGYNGDFGTPEQTVPARASGRLWESCMTINGNWGYHAQDHSHKSVETLVQILVDCVSKGGNLLLNVGPRADGTIQPEFVERLRAVGEWLQVHGESIYGADAGPFEPAPWGRCTRKGNTLYMHFFPLPPSGEVTVNGLVNRVVSARMLATGAPVPFRQTGLRLVFSIPEEGRSTASTVVVLRVDGEPKVEREPVAADATGRLVLGAADATVHGTRAQFEDRGPNIGYWTDPRDYITWSLKLDEPGYYRVTIRQACEPATPGSTYEFSIGDRVLEGTVAATASWTDYVDVDLGVMELPAGRLTATVRPVKLSGYAVMNLHSVTLAPEGR